MTAPPANHGSCGGKCALFAIAFRNAKSINFSPKSVISGLYARIARNSMKTTRNMSSLLMIEFLSSRATLTRTPIRGLIFIAQRSDTVQSIASAKKIVLRLNDRT